MNASAIEASIKIRKASPRWSPPVAPAEPRTGRARIRTCGATDRPYVGWAYRVRMAALDRMRSGCCIITTFRRRRAKSWFTAGGF